MKKLLAAVTVLAVSTAQASTIYVDVMTCPGPGNGSEAEPYCSIQTAIDNAVDTDEIVVAPGTYFEAINFNGVAVWLHSSDGADVTIIDAQEMGRVVTCSSGEGPDTELDGFLITGGNAHGDLFPDTAGGGMFIDNSSPTVTNCSFRGNVASCCGGGMYNNGSSSPTVTNCTFNWNTSDFGGGMYNNNTSPTVISCTFNGNSATYGGGMFNGNGDPTVINCTFTGNGNTGGFGGGMYNSGSSSPTVTNCTFTSNTSIGGGGMTNLFVSSPTVTNCVLWGNSPDEISTNGESTTVMFSIIQGGWPGTGNIDADPMFDDPDNGDYRLSPGSPCIDAGDNAALPKGVLRDLDGNPRFVADACAGDSGATVDMGAYEFQGTSCDLSNIMAMLASWGSCRDCGKCVYDFDGDCSVGILDLLILLGNWS